LQFALSLGMYFGGCLMLLGVLSACTIIGLQLGTQLISVGLLMIIAFAIARHLMREAP
jgi:hypothetical protein